MVMSSQWKCKTKTTSIYYYDTILKLCTVDSNQKIPENIQLLFHYLHQISIGNYYT